MSKGARLFLHCLLLRDEVMRPRQLSHQWRDNFFLIQWFLSTAADFLSKSPVDPISITKKELFMSGLKVETLQREFFYNGSRIPDPAPNLSVEEVRELLTPSWPEIATATLEGPEDTGNALRYTFNRAIGSKG
jgi:PRTRC genetic system protein C